MLWLYNILLWIYNFFTFLILIIMKAKIRIVIGSLLLMGGICLWIFGKDWTLSTRIIAFIPCFTGSFLLVSWIFWKKRANEPKSDEMSRKVGYTSLALSCQFLLLITMLVLLADSFFPFLWEYNAKDMAVVILMLGGFLVLFSSRYYSHHPDKTWL